MSTRSSTKTKLNKKTIKVTKRDSLTIRECLVDALYDNNYESKLPKMSMDIVKLVLPYLRAADPKWKEVSVRGFDKNNVKSHSTLYESLRHALESP